MNLSHFVAKRMTTSESGNRNLPIVNIAICGVALGVCIMLLTIFIFLGYRKTIHKKALGFAGNIKLVNYDTNTSYQTLPISAEDIVRITEAVPNIKKISPYALIGGIATAKDETEAIILKGVDSSYNRGFFKEYLEEGRLPIFLADKKSNEVLISQTLSNRIQRGVGDKLYTHFLQKPPRSRAFDIVGIYSTGISEFDKLFVIGDIRQAQKIYNWDSKQYSGANIFLSDSDLEPLIVSQLKNNAISLYDDKQQLIKVVGARKEYAYIFDWLDMMNINVKIILMLIILVSSFNMVSSLLVIILEKKYHIGVLKSLGMTNAQLQKIFLYKSAYIIGKGMMWGNIFGLSFSFLQQHFHWIKLNPESYYLSFVPIDVNIWMWLMLNAGVLSLTLFIMIIPTLIISRISPIKVIRF